MLHKFEAYIPERWYEEGALVRHWNETDETKEGEPRTGEWTEAVRVSIGDTVVINAIVLSVTASRSALSDYPAGGEEWRHVDYAKHSASATNQSFAGLFEQFKSGVKLINNEHLRGLAKAASKLRHKKPDERSWPKKLADDVKDADD